jgi:hypothetical protein
VPIPQPIDAPADWSNEFELCRAWTRLPRSIHLSTTDGRSVDFIHLGVWTHGLGPDFRNALICIDNGPVIEGSIELHLRSHGWIEHGHHLDPAYNQVVLHVVTRFDATEIRRADGKLVPTVVLDASFRRMITANIDWSIVGGEVCAEHIARDQGDVIRDIIGRLGDIRLSARTAAVEGSLQSAAPEPVLFGMLMDALGYSRNRDGMRAVVDAVPWSVVTSVAQRGPHAFADLTALLLGVGGYLPMSDIEGEHAGISAKAIRECATRWTALSASFGLESIPPTIWQMGRVRPGNHPALRLVQAASLVAATGGRISAAILEPLRLGLEPSRALQDLVAANIDTRLGDDRARAIAVNVVMPFAFGLGQQMGDTELINQAGTIWESMPGAESNERTRRATRQVAGEAGIRRQGARIQQGLIHLDRTLCEPRRCFECPVASLVLSETGSPTATTLG